MRGGEHGRLRARRDDLRGKFHSSVFSPTTTTHPGHTAHNATGLASSYGTHKFGYLGHTDIGVSLMREYAL